MAEHRREPLYLRSAAYLKENGVRKFLAAAFSFVLPESLVTWLAGWREVLASALSAGRASPHSVAHVLRACRHGFTQEHYTLYGLATGGDPSAYLNDVSRRRAKVINDDPELMNNKRRFYEYLRREGFDSHLPAVYGRIRNGTFVSEQYDSLRELVDEREPVVVKRETGGGGNAVYICTTDDEGIQLHGKGGNTHEDVDAKIAAFDSYLVTEFVEQDAYIERVYPHSTNTIRLLTLRTSDGRILIPAAVHRIGSAQTGYLDNFSQGGLSAAVDIETGDLSAAAERRDGAPPRWHETHPDTGAQIEGTRVPGWEQILDRIRTIVAETDGFRYVGWDLVVTGTGEFTIIEANSFPGPRVIQVHGPLLTDQEVRQFYADHGVVS